MTSPDFKSASLAIDDDLALVRAGAMAIHLAFAYLEDRQEGHEMLAQTLWFAANNIETAVKRIEKTLDGPAPAEEASS